MATDKGKSTGNGETPNDEVGFNGECNALSLRRSYLREQCADEIGEYMHLKTCVAENLKTDYMLRLGQFECKAFCLKIELARWQRRFTLYQVALNHGEKPDLMAIEAKLDKEFEEFVSKIKENEQAVEDAAGHASMERMDESQSLAIRVEYINAVKRLHPDLNPDLPESAKALWHRIQSAYKSKDWPELSFLVGLVDDVLGGKRDIADVPGGLEGLRKEIAVLVDRLDSLKRRTEILNATEPFIWRKLLRDNDEVARRRELLEKEIDQLTKKVSEYAERWNERKVA